MNTTAQKTLELQPVIFLDIETIPYMDEPSTEGVQADKRLKDPDKIAADIAKKRVIAWKDQSLETFQARTLCISVAVNDGHPGAIAWGNQEDYATEPDMLLQFHKMLLAQGPTPTVVGFNIREFDLPKLRFQAMVHGLHDLVRLLTFDRYSSRVVDLREVAHGSSYVANKKGTLDQLAARFGLPGKPTFDCPECPGDGCALCDGSGRLAMDGSKVCDLWQMGHTDVVRRYAEQDVAVLQALAPRMLPELWGRVAA